MVFDNVREALDFITQVYDEPDAFDTDTLSEALRDFDTYAKHVLPTKAKNAESRRQVESGTVTHAGQTEKLNPTDIKQTILLSDTFNLDELQCIRLMTLSGQQKGVASAVFAAVIYMEERNAQVACLWYLLQTENNQDVAPEGVKQMLHQYITALLKQEEGGKRTVLNHLLRLIKEKQADPSIMETLIGDQGEDVSLTDCLAAERTSLCQCVVYACQTEPCVPEGDVVTITQQLLEMGNDFHGITGQEVPTDKQATFQQAYAMLVAFLAAILPPVINEGVDDEPPTQHERALSNLANSSELKRLLEGGGEVTSGFHAVAKLAWGVMLRIVEQDNHQAEGRAANCIHAACEWGVFRFLYGAVLGCHMFVDEQPPQQEAYTKAMHKLAIQFLNAARNTEVPSLLARSKEETSIQQPQRQHPDSLASLLHCLASLYKLNPDLWLDESIKPDIVVPFMDYLRDQSVVAESAPLLVAWLDLLTGMASGPQGASTVFGSLLSDAAGKENPVSWMRMLGAMREYCIRYGHQPEEEEQAPGRSRQDCLVPPEDVAGMSAFLKLFSQVMRDAADGQVVSWVRSLEEESGIVPLWEVMFQLMCHPVPQTLKAACDEAISVMVARGGQAGAMWERLLAAVVVMPESQDDAAVSQYDISYQLNEIEARSEDFCETLAFVRLLNTLWQASGPSIHDSGRPYAHFTLYVLHTILAPINQRRYKDAKQKWELFTACLQHLRLVVQALRPGCVQAHAGTQTALAPGLTIMLDLLRGGTSLAAVSHLIEEGVTKLLEARGSPAGAAHEATLLAALRLLNTALETDHWLLQELRQHPATGQYTESLDAVLKHDSRRISKLISCIGYTSNSSVQLEAIKLTQVFAARQPHLVEMLVQQRVKVTADGKHVFPAAATWQRIRFAFGGCLQEALNGQNSPLPQTDNFQSASAARAQDEGPDPRAVLILQLLLGSLHSSNLNLTHMLMGFDVTKGVDGVYNSELGPQQGFSCLSVVLNLALVPGQPHQQPLLYEKCLQLLYRLSEHLQTRDAMLTLLRQATYSLLISRIGEVLPADDFEQYQGPTRSARLYQAAWLLQLAALELHHADLAVQDASCRALLQAYFIPEDAEDQDTDEFAAGASSFVVSLLYFFGTASTQQPQYVNELSSSVRQSLRDMAVDALLQSTTPVSKGGVLIASSRGQMCYDLGALTRELQKRYQVTAADNLRYSGDTAEGTYDLRNACREALRFAQRYNAWLEEAAALLALVQAWQQLVAVAVTKRFDILHTVASANRQEAGQEAGLKVVQQLLMESLPVLHDLLQPQGHSLVLPIAQVVEACMARMQEQALHAGLDSSSHLQLGLAGGLVPAMVVQLLHSLLAVLAKGQSEALLRPHLYAALLSFMQYCQGSRPAQASPHILKALLQAGHANGNSDQLVANIDEQAREVEEGVSAALAGNLSLLGLVIRDAAASSETISPAMKAQALTLLATWVVADPSHSVAGRIRQQELPARILEDLVNRAHVFLPGPHGQMAVQVIEAQLTLLLRLSSVTQASGQSSDSLNAISKLIHCKVIDFEPEEPVQRGDRQHQSSRRKRITRVLLLVLQVINSELAWQQNRSETRSQAVSFVAQHCRMMQRVLREAGVGTLNGWKPGEQEAELATLVLSLVTQLPLGQLSQQPGAPADAIREGAHHLLQPFSCASEDSHSHLVQPTLDDTSTAPPASIALKVARLKCALARYLVWEVNASPDFRYQIRPSPSTPAQPCLLQLATMLKQAARDREAVNADRQELIDSIQAGQAAPHNQQLALQVHGSRASKHPGDMASLLTLAAQKERQLQQTCLLSELVLAVMLKHLSEADGEPSMLSRLGDSRALAALQRTLDPTLDYLLRHSKAYKHAESIVQMAGELQSCLTRSMTI